MLSFKNFFSSSSKVASLEINVSSTTQHFVISSNESSASNSPSHAEGPMSTREWLDVISRVDNLIKLQSLKLATELITSQFLRVKNSPDHSMKSFRLAELQKLYDNISSPKPKLTRIAALLEQKAEEQLKQLEFINPFSL